VLTFNKGLNNVRELFNPLLKVSTRNANGLLTRGQKLIPNGVKCNEKHNWVSVLRQHRHNQKT